MRDVMSTGLVGQMLTHRAGNQLVAGATFAIDNGVVRLDNGRPVTDPDWSEDRWLTYLDRYQHAPGCLFAVVPDVIGDATATNERWACFHGAVCKRGYRPAYVLQNGCQSIPWSAHAVFIGGDDQFKLGPGVRRLVGAANQRGLWVHMGRVNSLRRLRYAADIGCDSVDGTFLAFGPDINLARLTGWLQPAQPSLFGGVA